MDMISQIFNPAGIQDYSGYFQTILSISGILFGLAFTAIIFIMQNGFNSFKFSRKMFLEIYLYFSKNILYSLAYIIMICLLFLYLPTFKKTINLTFVIFSYLFTKSLLDHGKHIGYLNTIFSNKFVPSNISKIRQYFRYIGNNGIIFEAILVVFIFAVVIFPASISYSPNQPFAFSEKSAFYLTLSLFIFSIIKIVRFVPEFFELSNLEMESQTSEEHYTENNIDLSKENEALEKHLLDHGFDFSDILNPAPFLEGTHYVDFLKNKKDPESWFNIHIEIGNTTPEEMFKETCLYAFKLLYLISMSKTDMNKFVLSFHIKIKGDKKRNIFFRTTRSELNKIQSKTTDPIESILAIENKLFDELFRPSF